MSLAMDEEAKARFMSKVDIGGPTVSHVANLEPCWLWTALTNSDGYGRMRVGGRPLLAHRISWKIHNGPIPAGMCILHRCDTPACVNPAHLFLGTQLDNIRDRDAKKRHVSTPGEQHGRAKLTEAQVLAIRAEYATGAKQASLAERFCMSVPTISKIVRRETWVHV